MYFRLPLASSSPPSRPNSAHNSRYPLSSPTTTPPSVCTQNSLATRRESNSSISDAKTARALLSRVASSPVVPPLKGAHPSSPLSGHHDRHHDHEHEHSDHEQDASSPQRPGGVVGPMERRWSDGYEAARGWTGHQQREGYISFPDYEKYFPSDDDHHHHDAATAAYAGHAASTNAQRREIQA